MPSEHSTPSKPARAEAASNASPLDHNPGLRPWRTPEPNQTAGKGALEVPGQAPNLVWQTRSAAPTDYENALGDALEQVFAAGADTIETVVAGLNGLGLRTPDGQPWDPGRFESEMRRLGA